MKHDEFRWRQCSHASCTAAALSGSPLCREHREQKVRDHQNTSDGTQPGGRQKKLTPEQHAELRRMWSQFVPLRDIARHFGISLTTAKRYVKAKP